MYSTVKTLLAVVVYSIFLAKTSQGAPTLQPLDYDNASIGVNWKDSWCDGWDEFAKVICSKRRCRRRHCCPTLRRQYFSHLQQIKRIFNLETTTLPDEKRLAMRRWEDFSDKQKYIEKLFFLSPTAIDLYIAWCNIRSPPKKSIQPNATVA